MDRKAVPVILTLLAMVLLFVTVLAAIRAGGAGFVEGLGAFLVSLGQFLTNLLEAVAWPLTILAIALIFRRQIAQKLGALTEVGYGGVSARFAQGVNEANLLAVRSERASMKVAVPKRRPLLGHRRS
jgi:hypothetical protein